MMMLSVQILLVLLIRGSLQKYYELNRGVWSFHLIVHHARRQQTEPNG